MKEILFKSEEIKKRKDAADILRQIADKVEEGNILLKKGSEEVSVDLPEKMEVEIKASKKEKKGVIKRELEVELEWKEGESGPVSIA
jgi:amphi-Trp domain-containing protein